MASNTNSSYVKAVFNESNFTYEILITDFNGNLVQKFYKDEILKLNIERDITKYYDTGTVLIKDYSNFYTVLANNTGKWCLSINIIQEESLNVVPDAHYSKGFIINYAAIESIDAEYAKVRINFIDPISQILNRNVGFSAQGNSDISLVLAGLLESAGFSLGGSGRTAIPGIENVGKSINYITDSSTSLLNHLDYVLTQTYSNSNGFLFLYYDDGFKPIWTKPTLNSSLDLSSEEKKYHDSAYLLYIQSSNTAFRNINVVTDIVPYTGKMPYESSTRIIYPTYIQEFNPISSRVEISGDDQWTIERFNTLFATGDENALLMPGFLEDPTNLVDMNISFFKTPESYAIGNIYRKSNSDKFYRNLRNYFIYNNMFSFRVQGQIWRQPGKVYCILYTQGANSSRFAGNWFCTKVVNEFESGRFYQNIFLTRVSDYVNTEQCLLYVEQLQQFFNSGEKATA